MSSSPAKKSSATTQQQPAKQPRVRRKVRALDYPKRPLSAYNLFFKSEQPVVLAEYKSQHNGEVDFPTIVKLVARRWKQLGEEDRFKYEEMAERNSDKYRQELWEYQKGKKKEKLEAKKKKAASASPIPPKKAVLTAEEECDSSVTVEDMDDSSSSVEVIEDDDDLPPSPPSSTKKNKEYNKNDTGKRAKKKVKPVEVEDISSREEENKDASNKAREPTRTLAPQAEAAYHPPTTSPPTAVLRGASVASLPQGDLERVLLHQNRARDVGNTAVRGGMLGGYPTSPQQGRRVLMEQDKEVARNMLIQDLRAIEAARDETIHRLIQLEDDSPAAASGLPGAAAAAGDTSTNPDISVYQLVDHRSVPAGMMGATPGRAGHSLVPPLLRGGTAASAPSSSSEQQLQHQHHHYQLPLSFLSGHLHPPEATNPLLVWRRQL